MRRLLKGVLTYVVIIPVITFALLEVTLRIYDALSPSFVFPDNSENRWRGKPHSHHYNFQINSKGFNDIEYDLVKPSGGYRIVALGDSFLYGVVPYESNFLTLLDAQLDRQDMEFEVINMGIPDTAPRQYHALFVKEGLAWDPDLVLVHLFIGNDFLLPKLSKSYARYLFKALLTLVPEYGNKIINPKQRYEDQQPSMSEARFLEVQTRRLPVFDPTTAWFETRLDEAIDYIVQIAELCRSRDIDIMVVMIPDELQVNDDLKRWVFGRALNVNATDFDFDRPNRVIHGKLTEQGIRFIDLLQPLRDEQRHRPTYKPRDTHWNIAGNRIAAEAVAEFIQGR